MLRRQQCRQYPDLDNKLTEVELGGRGLGWSLTALLWPCVGTWVWWKLPERASGNAAVVQPLHFSGEGDETPERLLLAQGHRPFLLLLKK